MKVVLQRVSKATVTVQKEIMGEIGVGYLLLVGFTAKDGSSEVAWLAEKIVGLRVFNDEHGKKDKSLEDVGGSALVVSQFTLYGDARKGRRPSFIDAAPRDKAKILYDYFINRLCEQLTAERVATGEFGAMMDVSMVNQGPFTLVLEK